MATLSRHGECNNSLFIGFNSTFSCGISYHKAVTMEIIKDRPTLLSFSAIALIYMYILRFEIILTIHQCIIFICLREVCVERVVFALKSKTKFREKCRVKVF